MSGDELHHPKNPAPLDRPQAKALERTSAQRRLHLEQALANTRISGHEPTAEYLADLEALMAGALSEDDVRQRIIDRASKADQAVSGRVRVDQK
jgi:hypothetical protein